MSEGTADGVMDEREVSLEDSSYFECGAEDGSHFVESLCVTFCGVTSRDKVRTVELRRGLGIECVMEVMRRGRLRWFGHVERKEVDD